MLFLSNIRIRTRLLISFSSLLILLLTVAVLALSSMNQLSQSSRKFVNQDVSQVMAVSEINVLAQSSALSLLQILPTDNLEQRIKLYAEMDQLNKQLDIALDQLLSETSINDRVQVEALINKRSEYKQAFMKMVDLVELDTKKAIDEFHSTTRPALKGLLKSIEQFQHDQQTKMVNEQKTVDSKGEYIIKVVTSLTVLALILGGLLAYIVSHSIVQPIEKAVQLARQISSGNLKQIDTDAGKDEVGDLLRAFQQMNTNLTELINAIGVAATEVADSATQMMTPVTQVSSRSARQLEAVSQITANISRTTVEFNQLAETASQSKTQVEKASALADDGQHRIKNATEEFEKISNTINESSVSIEALSDRAKAVRTLVSTVSEIADQTNLLALNAAIEAARAGESGRGFAVVADEVRNLAIRTGGSIVEINTVIDAMEKETEVSVARISNGRTELETGVTLIHEMVEPLSQLNTDASISAKSLLELQQSITYQLQEMTDIEKAARQIEEISEENSVAIKNISDTSQNLDNLSGRLKTALEGFTFN